MGEEVCEACRPLVDELRAEIAELKRRLAKYENAHTPPSMGGRVFSLGGKKRQGKKPGREEGHPGAFRPIPEPTGSVEVKVERCPHCAHHLGEPVKTERRVIEEIPEPRPVEVIEYRINHYHCAGCGRDIVAGHPGLPTEGRFGKNVLAQVTLMKYEERLPHRKIAAVLDRQYQLTITPGTSLDITRRMSDALQPARGRVLEQIRNAKVVNVDETSFKVDGIKQWLWTFATAAATFFVIRKSRGKKVLDEVLGKGFTGIIGCDGWRSYSNFTAWLQRCWAHLLREADFVVDKVREAVPFAKALHRLYARLTTALCGDPPPEERRRLFRNALAILHYHLSKPWEDERLRKLVSKVRYGMKHWFTFVLVPGVEPTNNRAERALREHVVQRKIIGTLRNEKGVTIHETIMTMLATWRQQGLNPFDQLRLHLS